ncbi:hypothetical protein [Ulvibacterium sp.]|uniref:hypothetical protein n=1 Tax=Ulvibacterium sp. TaxID=2665914 RepID=UPI0026335C84|nr:hypothetical protein [Ulvibacterium sp.]
MDALKIGSIVLSVWSGLNLFPSLYVVVGILFLGEHPPGLYAILSAEDIQSMSPDMLATVDSIGLFANLSVVALNALMLIAIWKGLINRVLWVFWALLVAFIFALLAGIAADYAVNFAFPEVNLVSALILALGFIFSGIGLFKPGK